MPPALDLKSAARQIFTETLSAIDIGEALRRKLARSGSRIQCGSAIVDLAHFSRIRIIAFGKASYAMAEGLVSVCAPEFPLSGICVGPTPPPRPLAAFEI